MAEQKLGKWEAVILVLSIVINHIILGLPRSIVAEHSSASILNVIYISTIVLTLVFIIFRSFSEGLKLIFFPRTSLPIIMILFLITIVVMNRLNIVSIARANLFFTILVAISMIFIFIGNWKNLTFQRNSLYIPSSSLFKKSKRFQKGSLHICWPFCIFSTN